jgi:peptidyl-prolyl isomerase D
VSGNFSNLGVVIVTKTHHIMMSATTRRRSTNNIKKKLLCFAFLVVFFTFLAKLSRSHDHRGLAAAQFRAAEEEVQERITGGKDTKELKKTFNNDEGVAVEEGKEEQGKRPRIEDGDKIGGKCGLPYDLHSEYAGAVVGKWGENNILNSADECCRACEATEGCNAFVFCGDRSNGCSGRKFGECWLKKQEPNGAMRVKMSEGMDVRWTSGALYTNEEFFSAQGEKRKEEEVRRKQRMKAGNVKAFFDVSIGSTVRGRIEFILYAEDCPNHVDAFRALLKNQGLNDDGYKGSHFYRILDKFIDQTGPVKSKGVERFDDDDYGLHSLKHDRFGLLSSANSGPNTNTGHFSIVVAPAPHLDTHYTIFGEVVSGEDIVWAINALDKTKPQPGVKAMIENCGEL